MRYLIVSDAHLGLGDIERSKDVFKKIKEVSEDYDKIIFNGDMIETWKYKALKWTPTTRAGKAKKLFKQMPELLEFMKSEKCIVNIGNHDIALESLGFERREYNISTPKGDILVIHGNEADKTTSYDYITSHDSWWIILGTWISSKITKLISLTGLAEVDEVEEKWNDILFVFNGGTTMVDYVHELFRTRGIFGCVTGHTHKQEIIIVGNKKYVNSGCCGDEEIQGVVVNSDLATINPITIKV